jgi:hypothetical protein
MRDALPASPTGSVILPHLIPRTKSGLPKLAVTRAEAADLCSVSVDTIERIPASELPVIHGRPVRVLLVDLVRYLERQRDAA